MTVLVVSFLVALVVTLAIVRSASTHGRISADHDLSGPQKFHSRPVPRVGGIAVAAGLVAGALTLQLRSDPAAGMLWWLLVVSIPTFAFGLAEDLTKSVSPSRRLFFTAVSAVLGIVLLDALVQRTDIPGLDPLLRYVPVAVALTVFAVTGVANSVNIIDGFNGLASLCVLMMVMSLGYVAFQVDDRQMLVATLVMAGAIIGFFVWNFPAGLIFLGDGGAYLLGFLLAELGVMLVRRNPGVSPMFPLLLCCYPIFETVFSIYRKKVLRGMSPSEPDGVHLHMLIYKRLMRWATGDAPERRRVARNSMTSPYLWLLCLTSVIPAVLWWDDTRALSLCMAAFVVAYLLLYWSIVRFRAPKWLIWRREAPRSPATPPGIQEPDSPGGR